MHIAMTPELLRHAGEALYGKYWQASLSEEIGVNVRSIRRWLSGEMEIPFGVTRDISEILAKKQRTIELVLRNIEIQVVG